MKQKNMTTITFDCRETEAGHQARMAPVPGFLECVAGIQFKTPEYLQQNSIKLICLNFKQLSLPF